MYVRSAYRRSSDILVFVLIYDGLFETIDCVVGDL